MDNKAAVAALEALAQSTRFAAVKLLAEHEPEGLAAGEIAERLGVPRNTMSTHLSVLSHNGVVSSERRSRTIIYRASTPYLSDLISFLHALIHPIDGAN
ncbi:ArsR/SmtB family transcription factor [Sphingomonas sp. PR090111-T3T-6A]|uniref:ArsR/SmtB family transcription factor n=1 Tax=Sphingomonas sp. PR090111-T3T-6A TaxID=685778 RepID=UPI000A01231A|nr:metalloregulator ArsR/SmtB family transcription factor [Sphingomonas sp. PR090111-T3T-6A]